jgi:hypothetical protein
MFWLPSTNAPKAIFRPSGDHLGPEASPPPSEVSFSAFDPSLSHTQISE